MSGPMPPELREITWEQARIVGIAQRTAVSVCIHRAPFSEGWLADVGNEIVQLLRLQGWVIDPPGIPSPPRPAPAAWLSKEEREVLFVVLDAADDLADDYAGSDDAYAEAVKDAVAIWRRLAQGGATEGGAM